SDSGSPQAGRPEYFTLTIDGVVHTIVSKRASTFPVDDAGAVRISVEGFEKDNRFGTASTSITLLLNASGIVRCDDRTTISHTYVDSTTPLTYTTHADSVVKDDCTMTVVSANATDPIEASFSGRLYDYFHPTNAVVKEVIGAFRVAK